MGHLWLFAVRGTAKGSRIIEVFEYARARYGVNHFIVDSLAKCGFNEDDYNGQKKFIDSLMEFAAIHNVHVHLVAHSRKVENEFSPPRKMDVKGTGAITDMVDNVIVVWRNKKKEDLINKGDTSDDVLDRPDALFLCEKQRNGDWEKRLSLWFDLESYQYLESQREKNKEYVKAENLNRTSWHETNA